MSYLLDSLRPLAVVLASLLIVHPFGSVLIRYRANYILRVPEIQIEGLIPAIVPGDFGYFGMMKRVNAVEGWTGFYKGFIPTFLNLLVSGLISSGLWFGRISFQRGMLPSSLPILGTGYGIPSILLSLLVGIPFQIIINRAIVTPYRLSIFGPSTSLKALLTPHERRHLWVLYLTPGLVVGLLLQWVMLHGYLQVRLLFLAQKGPYVLLYIGSLAIAIVFEILCVPLQVTVTKLSVQRNFGLEEASFVEETEGAYLQEYSTVNVNRTRVEAEPYTGLIDCAFKIMREEGGQTLFRAWWMNLLPHFFYQYL
ncbi:hypothetical protein GYMLUDRAFT_228166 [Collybiopsis luxurians FD-317 M1]|uniref:Uncharacterized protein n=1 Tax=Collybiopsis luxurians FD-317 M1 TaxID=944289 RepID=A0A0D0CRK4_9AGAR|nr:hypothetical protein GYMLUDRAFT_228166 [Collybiopsis luxurians FD-317 M1]